GVGALIASLGDRTNEPRHPPKGGNGKPPTGTLPPGAEPDVPAPGGSAPGVAPVPPAPGGPSPGPGKSPQTLSPTQRHREAIVGAWRQTIPVVRAGSRVTLEFRADGGLVRTSSSSGPGALPPLIQTGRYEFLDGKRLRLVYQIGKDE